MASARQFVRLQACITIITIINGLVGLVGNPNLQPHNFNFQRKPLYTTVQQFATFFTQLSQSFKLLVYYLVYLVHVEEKIKKVLDNLLKNALK